MPETLGEHAGAAAGGAGGSPDEGRLGRPLAGTAGSRERAPRPA
jgi:hypothetical protein